jgi:hypothetical protein
MGIGHCTGSGSVLEGENAIRSSHLRAASDDVNPASLALQHIERKLRAGGLLNKYI